MKLLVTNLLLWLLLFTQGQAQVNKQQKPDIQHGIHYKQVDDISQYWLSEKLDGMRGYWSGSQLFTRQGNVIHSPKWFTQNWPKIAIDGELWIDRAQFQQTLSCVRKTYIDNDCWRKVRFMIFDLPHHSGTFTERITAMQQLLKQTTSPYLAIIKQFKLNNTAQLEAKLKSITANKGEGLMLHLGSAYYYVGRTANVLKLKTHQDAEATVIAHLTGQGKYKGKLGALKVALPNGITFKIGSGFNDQERDNPPPIGSTITFKYNGKTQAGIPRFARFWRIRVPKLQVVDN